VDVLAYDGQGWVLRERIAGEDPGVLAGWSVDVSGEQLVVGLPGPAPNAPGGRMLVYSWSGTEYLWVLTHWSDAGPPYRLGSAVAVSGSRTAIGAPGHDVAGLGLDTGRVSVFQRKPGGYWVIPPVLLESGTPEAGAQFGFAVALDDSRLLAGRPFADPGGSAEAGLVTAYDISPRAAHVPVGPGLAGAGGLTPQLAGDGGMCTLVEEFLSLTQARVGAPVFLLLGIGQLGLPLKGGVLVPSPDLILAFGAIPPGGDLYLGWDMPTGLPAYSLWWQFWMKDADGIHGFSASNGLRADYPTF
jgi:hypothetical protein